MYSSFFWYIWECYACLGLNPPLIVSWDSLGGAKYFRSSPANRPDSAERPGRHKKGGTAGRGAPPSSISFSNDKLTLSKMYVRSHQSQLIKSLAAASSGLVYTRWRKAERKKAMKKRKDKPPVKHLPWDHLHGSQVH